jgi:hypothetical protein
MMQDADEDLNKDDAITQPGLHLTLYRKDTTLSPVSENDEWHIWQLVLCFLATDIIQAPGERAIDTITLIRCWANVEDDRAPRPGYGPAAGLRDGPETRY